MLEHWLVIFNNWRGLVDVAPVVLYIWRISNNVDSDLAIFDRGALHCELDDVAFSQRIIFVHMATVRVEVQA